MTKNKKTGTPKFVEEFTLEGDKDFLVTRQGDVYTYEWTNHPDRLGFESMHPVKGKVDHKMVVLAFLRNVDHTTGEVKKG
ncbi:hypothetical protein [Brevibacterium litoralis]|uniref:hypothetical protein n=1 Tax=Brevibacterium litoralis TaxID=3138935 RepID=UPI0032ED2242